MTRIRPIGFLRICPTLDEEGLFKVRIGFIKYPMKGKRVKSNFVFYPGMWEFSVLTLDDPSKNKKNYGTQQWLIMELLSQSGETDN